MPKSEMRPIMLEEMKDDPVAVGRRVRAIRVVHKMNKSEFARSLGVKSTQYTVFENGGAGPSIKMVQKIREVYHIDLEFIYFGVTALLSPLMTKALLDADRDAAEDDL